MREKIEQAVRTSLAKYGLKANSVTRIVNMIEGNISAMGTLEENQIDGVIQTQITGIEPLMGIFQSEIDSYRTPQPQPQPQPAPQPQPQPQPQAQPLEDLKRMVEEQNKFIQQLQRERMEQQQGQFREGIIKSLKDSMFPNGVFDKNAFDATCYELSGKFVQDAKVEELAKEALIKYNERVSSTNTSLFAPSASVIGGTPAPDEARKQTQAMIEDAIKNSRI